MRNFNFLAKIPPYCTLNSIFLHLIFSIFYFYFMEDTNEHQKTTLSTLTQNLIIQLKKRGDKGIELSQACKLIDAQKRRLYDVVNVLQGVGLVEKYGKSRIKWCEKNTQAEEIEKSLEAEENELQRISDMLDQQLEDMFHSDAFKNHAWVTGSDVESLKSNPEAKLYALKGSNSLSISLDTLEDGTNQLHCHSDDCPIAWISIQNPHSQQNDDV